MAAYEAPGASLGQDGAVTAVALPAPAALRRFAFPGLPPFLACLVLLGLWQTASACLDIDGLPSVPATLETLPDLLSDPEVLLNILASLVRMISGFVVALVLGLPLGLLMGRSKLAARFFNPLLMVTYPVPKAALMPIIMLWLGVGNTSKILVIVLGVSLPVIYHAYSTLR